MTLITSQVPVTMPENLSGTVMSIGTVTAEDRQAILSSYGAPEIARMCEPFTTAYELAIAAECAGELFVSALQQRKTRAAAWCGLGRPGLDAQRGGAATAEFRGGSGKGVSVSYLAFAASYLAAISAGTRPRSLI